ncbi:unnamed protein product, partial [Ixodes persulcatus]
TSAELLYGTTLRLPGHFVAANVNEQLPDPLQYVSRLRTIMNSLRPTPTRAKQSPTVYLFEELDTSTHIFLRRDAVRKPLQPPYDGPFKVLRRGSKHYTIEVRGQSEVVSVDRLKPAHLEHSITTPTSAPTRNSADSPTTRGGRRVRQPVRFVP